jgi:hypothetical protein
MKLPRGLATAHATFPPDRGSLAWFQNRPRSLAFDRDLLFADAALLLSLSLDSAAH